MNQALFSFVLKHLQQECIPVGCVLPAAVAISWGRGLLQCMLGYTSPLGLGLETPQSGPGDPLVVGLETPWPDPSTPPWVWACRPLQPDPSSSPLGVGLEICKACWDTNRPWRPARHAGLPPARNSGIPPPCGQTDTCKNINFANFVCRW